MQLVTFNSKKTNDIRPDKLEMNKLFHTISLKYYVKLQVTV